MASVNKVILIGNLGKEPEIRYAPSGDAICNITLATTDTWRDKASGEKREATEWHRVVFFGKLGEIANQYLNKGSAVYVEGSLRTRKWQDKDGQDRYTTEIRADEMKMLGDRQRGSQGDADNGNHQQNGNGGNRPNGNSGNQRDPSRQADGPRHQGGGDNRQGNGGNRQGNRSNGNSGGSPQGRQNQGGGRNDQGGHGDYGHGNYGGNSFDPDLDQIPF